MSTQRASLGASGERAGARFLLAQGWQILDQNLRLAGGEIDLLARDGDEIVVVEVKTRTVLGEADPTANLNPLKMKRLARLAQAVADRYPEASVRVDALVIIQQPYSISHYEDILN